jgi:hypothetical protein
MQKAALPFLLLTTLSFACSRERLDSSCQHLTDGLTTNDNDKVEAALNHFISSLSSNTYTASNINQLCQQLSSSCHLTAKTLCFDCIKTLPSQTEISITFHSGTATQTKTIDLSYTAANKIVFRNLHD